MRKLALLLFGMMLWPALVLAEPAKEYPERVPAEDMLAFFPFKESEALPKEMADKLALWAGEGLRSLNYDFFDSEKVEKLSQGKYLEAQARACAGDVECAFPAAGACKADWVLTGKGEASAGTNSVMILLGDVRNAKIHRSKTVTVQGEEPELKAEVLKAVSELLLGPEKPVTEDSEKPAEKTVEKKKETSLGYAISKWTTFGVGLGLEGAAVAFSVLAKQKQDDYNTKYARQAFVDANLRDEALKDAKFATAFYVCGSAVLATSVTLFILDALDIGKGPQTTIGLAPGYDGTAYSATLWTRY